MLDSSHDLGRTSPPGMKSGISRSDPNRLWADSDAKALFRRTRYPMRKSHRDRCAHKKKSQKVPVSVVQVRLNFLACLSRAHSPPSGTGFSAYKAFPAPAATCPRLAASPSRGFYRPAARGRMQTFTAPRAPPAGEIVRLVHICTRDLYAFVRETLTLSSLR